MPVQTPSSTQLHRTLKSRHLKMISLGGIIGAGLFVGSSAIIHDAGPGAFITYFLTGTLVLLVMRMLGEMAVAKPTTGSFMTYARMAMGNWAGFSTGWLYWYFWVIVVGFEAIVGGQIINHWLPEIPVWATAAVLLVVMTLVNLLSVKSFGEAEYWFASIKIAAIAVFLIVAGMYVFHLWPGGSTADFANLTAHGGFVPNGVATLFSGVVVVIFSMTGVEVVTIAAAESDEPGKNIRRAVNSVVFRILFFFVASTFLIVVIQPWNSIEPGVSPFFTALERIGIPGAGELLNAVILVAVLSVLNSGLYTSSRLLFVLAEASDAPKWMTKVNRQGVPVRGVIMCTVVGYGCVIIAAIWPETVFLFLINSSGAVFLFVYLMICLSQMILRPRLTKEAGGNLEYKMWLYPVLPLIVTGAISAVLVSMAFNSSTQASLYQSLIAGCLIIVAYFVKSRIQGGTPRRPSVGQDEGNLAAALANPDKLAEKI